MYSGNRRGVLISAARISKEFSNDLAFNFFWHCWSSVKTVFGQMCYSMLVVGNVASSRDYERSTEVWQGHIFLQP